MNLKLFLSLTFLIISFSLFSGNYDSLYVKKFKQKFTVRCGISSKNVSFTFSPLKKADTLNAPSIVYKPNINSYFNIGGSWRFLGGTISFKIPKPPENVSTYGRTSYTDLRFGITQKRFASSIYMRQYQGFYIDNPMAIYPQWLPKQPYPQRADIIYTSFGVDGYYVFKWKKFSLNAAFSQSEKQIKRAGSFMLRGDFSYIGMEADSSFIPYTQKQYYPEMYGLRANGFFSGVISGGYAYVFIIGKHWFVSPFLFTGFGRQTRGFAVNDNFIKNKTFFAFTDFKLNGGFNGNRFFSTINFDAENYFMSEKDISLQTTGAAFNINIGYRF